MAGARYNDRARKKTGLFERGQELLRLRRRVDDVVLAAIDQQETRAVLIDRGIAQRRSLEEYPAADHWRAAEQFLGHRIARAGDLVVLPLRHHVVDTIEADNGFDIGRGRGRGHHDTGWRTAVHHRPAPQGPTDARPPSRRSI